MNKYNHFTIHIYTGIFLSLIYFLLIHSYVAIIFGIENAESDSVTYLVSTTSALLAFSVNCSVNTSQKTSNNVQIKTSNNNEILKQQANSFP